METFKLISEERAKLDQYYASEYGKEKNSVYRPHVALGYFSNPHIANEVWHTGSNRWIADFERELGGQTIRFDSISLYAFSDMITYFKKAK